MDSAYLRQKHEAGLPYDQYVRSGTSEQCDSWTRVYEKCQLADGQRQILGTFVRRLNAIALSGIWCGDCVQQGPLIARIAEAAPNSINLRWLDRDKHSGLQERVSINAGHRVPVVIFCAEDFEPVSWFGDRSINRYRSIAKKQFGTHCPLPGAPISHDEMQATVQDWLEQFERVHLLLRLSSRLRQRHGD